VSLTPGVRGVAQWWAAGGYNRGMRWLAVLVLLVGCGGSSSGDDGGDDDDVPTGNGNVFEASISDVVVEIDYETGQEPFTGNVIGFGDTFDLTDANIDRLFSGTKQLAIPDTLADMTEVGDISDEELTVADLLALADMHRDQRDAGATKAYYVLFVSGHFADDTGVQTGVLGVSLGETGVIAMFKDVIRSTDVPGFPNVVRFVEQSTLIHELSHALGLVDNGVPLASQHRDPDHGAHCNNDRCVMFFANEGAADAAQFVREAVISGNTILFDDACLADVDALTGR
jgi:hypothetical protein